MRSSLSVIGSTNALLLSVMAIRYSPNNSMKGNGILFMLLCIDWIKKGILLVIND